MNIKKCKQIVQRDSHVIAQYSKMPYYPIVIAKAKGSIITDTDGNEFIDFLSSSCALNIGSSPQEVIEAIREQSEKFLHYANAYVYNEQMVLLAEKLNQIMPGSCKKQFGFGLSGSDANDGIIKLARCYTGRSRILSFERSYHGSSFGALSMTTLSLNMRRKIGPLLPDIHHIPYPDCYRCKFGKQCSNCNLECFHAIEDMFETYIPIEEVACIIMEPVAGDAGFVMPPKKYMERLYHLCKENGILFAVDEVQQGMGRSGKWLSIEHFDIVPDIASLGKGMASGLPLSAVMSSDEISQSMESPAHSFSASANPLSCVASLATIQYIEDHDLLNQAKIKGSHMKKRAEEIQKKYPDFIGDVRGIGMSVGMDIVKNPKTKERDHDAASKICYRAWEKGLLLVFLSTNVLRLQPPLTITMDELNRGMDIIEEAVDDYANGKIPDSVLKTVKGW